MLWDINVIPNGAGQGIPYASSWSSTHESFGHFPRCSFLPELMTGRAVFFFGSLLLGSSPGRSALQSAE